MRPLSAAPAAVSAAAMRSVRRAATEAAAAPAAILPSADRREMFINVAWLITEGNYSRKSRAVKRESSRWGYAGKMTGKGSAATVTFTAVFCGHDSTESIVAGVDYRGLGI